MNFPTAIESFSGPWAFLSNFHACTVTLDGEQYPSVEHAYQAAKTLKPERRLIFQVPSALPLDTPEFLRAFLAQRPISAGRAKKLGEDLPLRPDWDDAKLDVMRGLLLQKFYPTYLRRKLLATFSAVLVEGNYWHDQYWGICNGHCYRGPHEPSGENMLGQLLVEVRTHYGGIKPPPPQE